MCVSCVTVSKLKSDETFFKNPPLSCGRFFFLVVIFYLFFNNNSFVCFTSRSCSDCVSRAPCAYLRSSRRMEFYRTIDNNSHRRLRSIANWINIQHVNVLYVDFSVSLLFMHVVCVSFFFFVLLIIIPFDVTSHKLFLFITCSFLFVRRRHRRYEFAFNINISMCVNFVAHEMDSYRL